MQSSFVVAAARTRMGVGRRVGVRQDSSDSGVKTAATEAAVAACNFIVSDGRAVAGQHWVGRNGYGRSAAAATAEVQAWFFFYGRRDGWTNQRTNQRTN